MFCSIFLLFFGRNLPIPVIIFIVAAFNFLLLIVTRKIQANYIAALEEAIYLKRFDLQGSEYSEKNITLLQATALEYLKTNDERKIQLGFSMLQALRFPILPSAVVLHLDSASTAFRIETIKQIALFKAQERIPELKKRLSCETNSTVKWWLLDTLAHLNPREELETGRLLLQDPSDEVRAGALRILLSGGNLNDECLSLQVLQTMLRSSQPSARKSAARILKYIHIGSLDEELKKLILDEDDEVSSCAIEAIVPMGKYDLIPIVLERVLKRWCLLCRTKDFK